MLLKKKKKKKYKAMMGTIKYAALLKKVAGQFFVFLPLIYR